jgi:STE24 endopeptidase
VNPFFIVIIAAVAVEFILHLAANLLNTRALQAELPPDLEDLYRLEDAHRAREYTLANVRLEIVGSAFRLLLLLVFWFTGGFNYLDQLVRSWGFAPIINGLFYIGILSAGYSLVTIPLSLYDTFVIEERFGFNRTTPGTYVLDRIKGLLLAVLLGAPLLAGFLALLEYAGSLAWLYCWAGFAVFSLAMQFIVPTWIMPLFNRFTPMETGELRDAILDYTTSVRFPVRNLYVMDGSRRSGRSNAFFTGFGRSKRIALFDTLIAQHTVPELVAVLAHEIGHYKKKHVLQGMIIGLLHAGLLLYLLSLFIESQGLYDAFYVEQTSYYVGLLLFGLLYTPIALPLSIVMQVLSRRNEYTADRYAVETIDEPESLLNALKKLHTDNLSNLTPHPFYVFLHYSHPPLLKRLRAIRQPEGL